MFVTDTRAERMLTGFGVQWTYSNDISIDDLAPDWDRHNKGRRRATNDDAIQEYAKRTEDGEQAPAVVVLKRQDGKFDVLDGVQRISAAILLGVTRFSAYVVTTDSESVSSIIRVLANRKLSGIREDPQWELRTAIQELIDHHKHSIDEVARWLGVPKDRVESEKRYMDWSFEIRRIGGPQQMKKGIVEQIAEHAKLHDMQAASKPIAEFLHDVNNAKFTNGESAPFIERFFDGIVRKGKAKLFDQYNERLDAFRSEPEVVTRLEGRQRSRLTAEIKLRRALKSCLTEARNAVKSGEDIRYVEEFYHLWNQVQKELRRLDRHASVADEDSTP